MWPRIWITSTNAWMTCCTSPPTSTTLRNRESASGFFGGHQSIGLFLWDPMENRLPPVQMVHFCPMKCIYLWVSPIFRETHINPCSVRDFNNISMMFRVIGGLTNSTPWGVQSFHIFRYKAFCPLPFGWWIEVCVEVFLNPPKDGYRHKVVPPR